jgi:colicin import membrane protein
VSWQNTTPTEVQAEIWDMKVQDAAPPAPPTPEPEPQPEGETPAAPPTPTPRPTPKEPDIALERLKKAEAGTGKAGSGQAGQAEEGSGRKTGQAGSEETGREEGRSRKPRKPRNRLRRTRKKAAADKLAKEKAEKAEKAAKDKAFAAEMSRITGNAKGSTVLPKNRPAAVSMAAIGGDPRQNQEQPDLRYGGRYAQRHLPDYPVTYR